MQTSGLPFDDIRSLFARLPGRRETAAEAVRAAMRERALGQLEDVAVWLAAWSGRNPQRVVRPLVALFAGTHGVSARLGRTDAISATMARVERIAAGGAPVGQLCTLNDASLKVFDLALDVPTGDIAREDAFDERGAAATVAFGMEAIAGGADLLCIGDVGADNAVAATAVLTALGGAQGLVDALDERAREAVAAALRTHEGHLADPLEALRRLGSREMAAILGAILAARAEAIPVVLDGLPALAAAAVLHAAHAGAADHCIVAGPHMVGARAVAGTLGLTLLADFGIEAGEGTAAALAVGVVKAAAQVAEGMSMAGGTRPSV